MRNPALLMFAAALLLGALLYVSGCNSVERLTRLRDNVETSSTGVVKWHW